MEFMDIQYKVEKVLLKRARLQLFHKTSTSGSLTLLNGEEVISVGCIPFRTIVRQGVPLLKDLPWWVFGLRYIFGYDSKM